MLPALQWALLCVERSLVNIVHACRSSCDQFEQLQCEVPPLNAQLSCIPYGSVVDPVRPAIFYLISFVEVADVRSTELVPELGVEQISPLLNAEVPQCLQV